MAMNILGVTHDDVVVQLFVETLTKVVVDQFYHLAGGVMTSWNTMRTCFEAFFETTKDEHALLAQLTSVKKQPSMSIRDFVVGFNKIANRIPAINRPIMGNLKTFFISSMPLDINFYIRRSRPIDLDGMHTYPPFQGEPLQLTSAVVQAIAKVYYYFHQLDPRNSSDMDF